MSCLPWFQPGSLMPWHDQSGALSVFLIVAKLGQFDVLRSGAALKLLVGAMLR